MCPSWTRKKVKGQSTNLAFLEIHPYVLTVVGALSAVSESAAFYVTRGNGALVPPPQILSDVFWPIAAKYFDVLSRAVAVNKRGRSIHFHKAVLLGLLSFIRTPRF